ncbi:hypothetical protein [Methanothrix soehngenii]|jgi:hypothetical protein|uniref:hypothetical protein n=2 Tax=Methanothrix soehngenii TaxID=2223 RepID=UPI002BE301EA|nr:hypothetical protein [Methanothrix soehngenii]HOS22388.1 hypothetical protein [Methanothrix soehngenii]HPL20708.1 hypothetical protein [Methanothrix soehngenii]
MQSTSQVSSPLLAIPGVLASIFSLAIGLVALLTSLASFGRQAEYGYLISPGAGGILFIHLAIAGMVGMAIYLEQEKGARCLQISIALVGLPSLIIFAYFREWLGGIFLIAIAAAVYYSSQRMSSAPLLLFSGLVGFLVAQLAITTLPYGWKAWAIPGVLFVLAGLIVLLNGYLALLPTGRGRGARFGSRLLYALFFSLVAFGAIALLMQVPHDAGGRISNACGCNGSNLSASGTAVSLDPGSSQDLREEIIAPEDVRTFPQEESILFQAKACENEPCQYLWWSDRDGILDSNQSFSRRGMTAGWHSVTLTVTDGTGRTIRDSIELGVAPPSACSDVSPLPRYYPVDTPCRDIWPNGTESCQEIEVCHPDLDYIVLDAVRCCNGTASSPACAWARAHADGDNKRCRGLYIIRAFGPDAVYMQGYALFKACCSGYPECTRTSWPSLAGTVSFREGFNQNVANLSCRQEEWGVSAWRSDTNMSENSAVLGLFPAHATVNILQTGVCVDYAAALTTALRKAGYNKSEAMVAASLGYDLPLLGDHPGHAYNLVKLPGEEGYHIVDTTGNGEGINPEGLPHYFWFVGNFMNQPVRIRVFDWWVGYCSKISPYGFNDLGSVKAPASAEICGCPG